MKKSLIFFIFSTVILSCNKGISGTTDKIPEGTQQIKGMLHYDNFPDGWGLYYATEHENLIFKNTFSNADAQYQHFKPYVNKETTLSYTYKGDTSCLYGIGPVCGIRVVEVISLK